MEEGRRHYVVTLALLTVAGISFAIMQTLVVPALPFFQREFHTSASWKCSPGATFCNVFHVFSGFRGDR